MELSTRYLGLQLASPLIASAGPLTGDIGNIRALAAAGAGAVVLRSIFEEQIAQEAELLERLIETGMDSHAEASGYFPASAAYRIGTWSYLDLVRRAVDAVDIPVIASLNGVTDLGWVDYARQIEEAGAAALELNIFYVAADPGMDGRAVEQLHVDIVAAVRRAVKLPLAVKLGPYFSAFGDMAGKLVDAGADGLVLFNRFYEPDIDIARLAPATDVQLSGRHEIRLPLMWIGLLAGRISASLAATTGVESADEVVKYLLAGADVVMATSALLRHGTGHMRVLRDGLTRWMAARGFASIDELRGRMRQHGLADPVGYERANYIRILQSYR